MKKISLFAMAIVIGWATLAQTVPVKKDDKAKTRAEKRRESRTERKAQRREVRQVDAKVKTDEKTR